MSIDRAARREGEDNRRSLLRVARTVGALVALVGSSVLVGWAADLGALKSIHPQWVSMKANTAVGLLALGLAAVALSAGRRGAARALALGVGLLGAATLAEDLLGVTLGIDQLLFDDAGSAPGTGAPGRMAPNTAVSFVLLGAGGALLSMQTRRETVAGQAVCLVVTLLSFLGVLGYAYGVEALHASERYTDMALHTAIGLFLLSIALPATRPAHGMAAWLSSAGPGGLLTRVLIPVVALVPVVLDLLLMAGAGAGLYGPAFAAALHTLSVSLGLVALVIVTARALDRHDLARREAAEQLAREERKYRELFENMDAGFAFHEIVLDDEGEPVDYVFLDVNQRFEQLTGLAARDILGQRATEVLPGIEDDPADWIARFGRVAVTGETDRFEQYSQDLERWYSVLAYQPRPGSFATIFNDVTERRAHEERIEGLNRALRRQTARLSETNQWLESFNYSVSHDLRAPLRAIDGFSEAVIEDHGEELPEQARHYLQRVRAGAQRMGKLIDDLLQLSRVGRAEMDVQPTDLAQCVQETVADLRSAEPERRVELEVSGELSAEADPRLARMLMANLVGNAWKFTANEDVGHIEVGSVEVEGERRFYVRDDGAGFDPHYTHKLFGAFQRLHTDAEFPGTGVGLATVQRIVHRHGGRVWAEGSPGEGATFWFTLEPPSGDRPSADQAP